MMADVDGQQHDQEWQIILAAECTQLMDQMHNKIAKTKSLQQKSPY